MKTIFSIILLPVILLQTFAGAIIIIDFELNRSYVENTLCENKDNPQNNCHGICQLKKDLQKEENSKDSNPTVPVKLKIDDILFFQALDYLLLTEYLEIKKTCNFQYHYAYYGNIYLKSVFHPPEIA